VRGVFFVVVAPVGAERAGIMITLKSARESLRAVIKSGTDAEVRAAAITAEALAAQARSEAILARLTPEDRGSLLQFRAQHGRTWRAALREEWRQGNDCGWVRRVRNTLGPSGIYGIK
jgi:hypothetical protein